MMIDAALLLNTGAAGLLLWAARLLYETREMTIRHAERLEHHADRLEKLEGRPSCPHLP